MSTKAYLCSRYRKKTKSTSWLIRYLNACNGQIYLKSPYNIKLDYYHKEDKLSENLENSEGNLLGKTNKNRAANGVAEMSI